MPDGLLSDADLGIVEAPAPPAGGSAPALLSDADLGIGALAAPPAPSFGWGNWAERGVRGIPGEIAKTAGESWEAIKQGLAPGQIEHDQSSSFLAPPTSLLRTGKALAAIPSLIASPLTGAVKSFGGQGLAAAEHGIGSVIAPDIAARDDPQKMYEQAAQDIDTALMATGARGFRGVRGVPAAGAPEAVPARGVSAPVSEEPVPLTGPVTTPVATPRENLGISLLPPEAPHVPPPEATGARRSVGAAATPDAGPLAEVSPLTRSKLKEIIDQEALNEHTLGQRLDSMSQHEMLGELSDATRARMGALATNAPARNEIVNSIRQRAAEIGDRLRSSFDRAFGQNENRVQLENEIRQQRQRDSTPFWQEFQNTPIPPTPEVNALLPRLREAGALQSANRSLGIEGLPRTTGFEELSGGTFIRHEPNITSGGPQPNVQQMPTATAFQFAKEHLDSEISGLMERPGQENQIRRLTALKNELEHAIDNHPDERVAGLWREARDVWAAPTRQMKAMDVGYRLLTNNIHAYELPFITESYLPSDMRGLRVGLRNYLEDQLGRGGLAESSVVRKVLAPNNQDKIRAVIGGREADDLIAALEHEARMYHAPQNIVGGSATASRLGHNDIFQPPGGLLQNISPSDVPHNVTGAALKVGKVGLQKLQARIGAKQAAEYAKMHEELARIFTLQGADRDAVLRSLIGSEEGPGGAGRSVGAAATSPQTYGQAIRAGVDPAQAAAVVQNPGQQPLIRKVLERNRVGRPIRSERLAIGKENAVLNAGAKKAGATTPDVSLTRTQEPIQNFESSGRNHNYRMMANGRDVGGISLDARDPKSIMVNLVENYEKGGPNTLGPEMMRAVLKAVKTQYPEMQNIYGRRVSGARERARSVGLVQQKMPGEYQNLTSNDVVLKHVGNHSPYGEPSYAGKPYYEVRTKDGKRVVGSDILTAEDEADALAKIKGKTWNVPRRATGGRLYRADGGASENDTASRNRPYVRPVPASYATDLGGLEPLFRSWVKKNKVPFDPDGPVTDYDMRGFYRGLVGGDPRAASAIDPNDKQIHYPDYWKTPQHETFSNESQWATPNAPQWSDKDQLIAPSGRILFDDQSRNNISGDAPRLRATGGRVEPNNINHSPTESQKAAGNYAKDHVRIHGLDLTIENPKGGERKGTDRNGKSWSVKLPAAYGYIKRTEGADGDHIDVYLGPHKRSPRVFVIDQVNADSKAFDEHKAFIGFASKKHVERTYHKAFSDGRGPERMGHLHEMSIGAFKDWLKNGDTTKPIERDARKTGEAQ